MKPKYRKNYSGFGFSHLEKAKMAISKTWVKLNSQGEIYNQKIKSILADLKSKKESC